MTRKRILSVTIHDCEVQTDEHWVPIRSHPDYDVCHHGNVRSRKYQMPRLLKAQPDGDGYLHVVLSENNIQQTTKVAHLIAEQFIGPRPRGAVLCHNNGDKTDNRSCNLRYDTQVANIADKRLHGTQFHPKGERNGMSKLTKDDVVRIRTECSMGGTLPADMASTLGVSIRQVRDVINRKAWAHVK